MKALLTAFGTDGDAHPFIALALAMRARGDEPVLMLNPLYAETAARLKLPFIPVGERWHIDEVQGKAKYMHPLTGVQAVLEDLYVPRIVPTFRVVTDAIERERPDAVVAHLFSYGASWAARAAGVPDAIVTLAPSAWLSKQTPGLYSAIAPPLWMRPSLLWLARAVLNRAMGKMLKGPCAELGVPWRNDWFFLNFEQATANLGLWSPDFRGPVSDDPPRAVFCGFPFTGESREPPPIPDDVRAFLDAGPPPVVIGLGTSARDLGGAVYAAAAAACAELGERCLLIGPASMEGLPPTAMAVRAAPYVSVFARARVIIHHGGINTTAEAMRSGVPAIVVPFLTDQFDNAERAQRMGNSLMLTRGRATKKGIVAALRAMMDPARVARAQEVAALLRDQGDGAERAAECVAELANAPVGALVPA